MLPILASGVLAYIGEWHMTKAKQAFTQNPLAAFEHNMKAHDVFPLDSITRMQTILSLGMVMDMEAQVIVYDKAADRVYNIARSAQPYHPLVLLLRAEYLLQAVRNQEEVSGIMDYFAEHVTQQPAAMAAVKQWSR